MVSEKQTIKLPLAKVLGMCAPSCEALSLCCFPQTKDSKLFTKLFQFFIYKGMSWLLANVSFHRLLKNHKYPMNRT